MKPSICRSLRDSQGQLLLLGRGQSRQSRWQVVSWHTPPRVQGLGGRVLPPGGWRSRGLPAAGWAPQKEVSTSGNSFAEKGECEGSTLPPSCGSGLKWLQVLHARVCAGDSDGRKRGPGRKPEPPGREPGSAGPGFSQVCPGQTSVWLRASLFIRGVNNPVSSF